MAEISQLRLRGVVYDLRDLSKISISEKGAPNGVAELNEYGQIPSGQFPTTVRYGTTEEWNRDITLIPKRGEVIVYSDHGTIEKDGNTIDVPAIKVGDGLAYLIDLPFVNDDTTKRIMDILNAHIMDSTVHVTDNDKERWDNKLNYSLQNETLILNRL